MVLSLYFLMVCWKNQWNQILVLDNTLTQWIMKVTRPCGPVEFYCNLHSVDFAIKIALSKVLFFYLSLKFKAATHLQDMFHMCLHVLTMTI